MLGGMRPSSSPIRPAPTGRRRPSAFVVRDPRPDEIDARVDWSFWYLTDEEDLGQSVEQGHDIKAVLSSLDVLLHERASTRTLAAFDNFFAWMEAEPNVRVSPDVYLLDDAPPPPWPKTWQTWLPGHKAPRWALEIVSGDWKKDYEDNPPKYAQLGTRELVLFDPHAPERVPNGNGHDTDTRVRLQVYRRDVDGAFVRVYRGNGPARSEELDAWIVNRPERGIATPRLARDAAGTDLVPTADEAVRAAEAKVAEEAGARRLAEDARTAAEAKVAEEAGARRLAEDARTAAEAQAAQAEDARRAAEAQAAQAEDARRAAETKMAAMEAELRKLRG
jgi:Uma2 family endonuclease